MDDPNAMQNNNTGTFASGVPVTIEPNARP